MSEKKTPTTLKKVEFSFTATQWVRFNLASSLEDTIVRDMREVTLSDDGEEYRGTVKIEKKKFRVSCFVDDPHYGYVEGVV